MDKMDKEQLDTFLSLVIYKNFTKSAEMLHVAQSTVSARLKSLEQELGKPLLKRTKKSVELTPSGFIFLTYAKRIIELFEESKKELALDGQYTERFVLGGPSSAWNYIFRDALSTFAMENRNVSLELKTHSSENTISKVLDGVIDLGVSYTKPTHPNILVHEHIEDHFKFVSRFPLDRPIQVEDFNSKKFILNNWGDAFLEWYMGLAGMNQLPALSMNQTAIVLKMIEEQDYFTLLPSMIAQPFINDKKLCYLESEFEMPAHHMYIFTPKDLKKEPTIHKILELLKK
ncbi:LysR family transcriptional regulator [Ornithinibacillus gellani]|nr:LysR family transcriptional regulator [Ornithinibacillus gellani]